MFTEGSFNTPVLVHGVAVPGTATMTRLKAELHWTLQETPRGAKIIVVADNKEGLDAVHEFLRFQIEDHKTGDCPMVH
jgi:16S rRNA G1207 methylase RsmC